MRGDGKGSRLDMKYSQFRRSALSVKTAHPWWVTSGHQMCGIPQQQSLGYRQTGERTFTVLLSKVGTLQMCCQPHSILFAIPHRTWYWGPRAGRAGSCSREWSHSLLKSTLLPKQVMSFYPHVCKRRSLLVKRQRDLGSGLCQKPTGFRL